MSRHWSLRRILTWLLVGLGLCAISLSLASAATVVQLAWDANTESDLAGYRILYGTTSGAYTGTIDVGNVISYAVSGLTANTTYYFAVVAYDQAGNVSLPSNEVSVMPTVLLANPTVTATDSPDPVAAGANLTYTLSYSNSGNVTATGVVISDTIPANTSFVSATGGGTLSGSVVSWSIASLAAGASGSVTLTVKVSSPLANGTIITNSTYSIVSNETTAVAGPTVTTTVMSTPILAVTSTDAPDPVAAGANLIYTLSYSNSGNANATSLVLTDAIPANTTFVSAGSGTLSGSVVTWSIASLPAGASGSVTLTVKVNNPLANGTIITNGTYSIDAAETAPVSGAAITTTVTSAAILTVAATDAPDPVAAGANLTYTLSYSNSGNANATGLVISDTIPANTSFVSATGGGTLSGSVVTWSIASLATGASGSVTLTVKVSSPLANGTVITNSSYSILSNETSAVSGVTVSTTVTSAPILTISKSASASSVIPGANLTYTLSYSNSGNANATGLVISDTTPANTSFVSATGGGTLSGSVVTWSVASLAAGASGSVQVVVSVASPLANGTIITNSTYSIDAIETAPVSGAAVSTTVTSAPILTVAAADAPDPVAAGANLTYTLSYSNSGNTNATGLVISDTIPANTSFVSATGGGTLSGSVVSWSIASLATGASGSVQVVVRVASPLANGTVITNSSYSIDAIETAPVSGAAVTTTVTSAPILTVAATDAPDPVAAGANLTYTLSYSNSGNANATGLVISDTIPANTSFVSATSGGTLSGSVVSWSIASLATGASGSVQVVVRVASPLANGTVIHNQTYSIASVQTTAASGPDDTTTVTSAPIITISKSASASSVIPGANLTYTLSYSNSGNANATGLVISDTIPANTSFVSATGGGTLSGSVVSWPIASLAAGASGSVTLTVNVSSPLANGTVITNSAYSIVSNETSTVSGAAVSTTVMSSAPALTIASTDAPDPVAAGTNLTYTLSYSNSGNANATGLVITDTIPANTSFVSATRSGTLSGSVVSWSINSLAAGASSSVTMTVKVNSPLANGTVIHNQNYSIASAQTTPVTGPDDTTTVTSSAPVLTIAGSDAPDPVSAGSNLTYTLSYSNSGNASATGLVISDTIPANTSFVSATSGGTLSGSVVSWSIASLAVGASGSVTLTVKVNSPLANGTIITNSSYSILSNETSAVSGAAVSTTVTSAPILTVTSTDAPDPIAPGANLTYTLSYSNSGNGSATGLVISDTIPANTSFVSATSSGTLSGSVVSWSIASLAAGTSGSVQLVVRVASPLANGTVITNSSYSILSNETSAVSGVAVSTTVTSAPILTISKSSSASSVIAGANVTYTLSYSNSGNANATGLVISDTIPANTSFVSTTSGGTLSGSVVTWSIASLAAGASGSVTLTVKVNSPLANGTIITNSTYSIDAAETAPVSGAAVSTTVTSAPILTIASTDAPDPVAAGATLTYTLSYSNSGNANATGAVITDTIPANTSFVSATGGGTLSGSVVSWSIASLAAGASGSVTMTVKVNSPLANGTVIHNQTYTISSPQTTSVSGSDDTTTVTSAPILAITKSALSGSVSPGANLTYTLSYSNSGNANATGLVITDTIPANTSFVSATGGGTLSGSVVSWSIVSLAAGTSGSVTLTVKVSSPLANGTVITNSTYSIVSNETAAVAGPTVTTTVTSAPILTVASTDAPDPVAAGANLTYTLSYSNSGSADATGVLITDTIPANTSFVSATGGGTLSGSVVSWSIASLAAGGSGSLTLTVKVSGPLANGTIIHNQTYTIASAQTTAVSGSDDTTTVTSAPVLTIASTDAPDPVAAGANLTYTFSYSNSGNANATGLVISDTIPVNTSFVSATGGGTLSGSVVTWSIASLAASASGSVTLTVKVNSPMANGTVITNGTYSIDAVETTPVSGAAVTTTVTSAPVLTIASTDAPDPIPPGANLTYTLSCSNSGNADATGVVITDTIPANTSFVSATSGGTLSGSVVSWSFASLAAGGSGSVTMTVKVSSPLANGTIIHNQTYTIASAQNTAVSGLDDTTTVTSAPILAIASTDAPDPVLAGANLTYTLSYSNSGSANATGLVITDTIPANTSFVSATGGGTLSGSVVSWSIASLAAGASGSVTLTVKVGIPLANGTVITNSSYSIDAAETAPVSGAADGTTVQAVSTPTVVAAVELLEKSIYMLRPGVQNIEVTGTNFQQGAVLALGSGITSSPTIFVDPMHLKATLTIDPTASLGSRSLTVTNPDAGTTSLPAALSVVRTPDINGDCMVDGGDLNVLARAWGSTVSSPSFRPEADLNGDGVVDGFDLNIFVVYFGARLPGCP